MQSFNFSVDINVSQQLNSITNTDFGICNDHDSWDHVGEDLLHTKSNSKWKSCHQDTDIKSNDLKPYQYIEDHKCVGDDSADKPCELFCVEIFFECVSDNFLPDFPCDEVDQYQSTDKHDDSDQ